MRGGKVKNIKKDQNKIERLIDSLADAILEAVINGTPSPITLEQIDNARHGINAQNNDLVMNAIMKKTTKIYRNYEWVSPDNVGKTFILPTRFHHPLSLLLDPIIEKNENDLRIMEKDLLSVQNKRVAEKLDFINKKEKLFLSIFETVKGLENPSLCFIYPLIASKAKNITQRKILLFIYEKNPEGCSVNEIAEELKCKWETIKKECSELSKLGLITETEKHKWSLGTETKINFKLDDQRRNRIASLCESSARIETSFAAFIKNQNKEPLIGLGELRDLFKISNPTQQRVLGLLYSDPHKTWTINELADGEKRKPAGGEKRKRIKRALEHLLLLQLADSNGESWRLGDAAWKRWG